MAGVKAGEAANYVPADANVLAATALAAPGETKTVVVELPAGEYSFICTFPGHYMLMRGLVKVQ
jgi:azurin